MKFGADVRKLHSIFLLILAFALPIVPAAAQQVGRGQVLREPQSQTPQTVSGNSPPVSPSIQTPVTETPVAPPPLAVPTVVPSTPPATTAPKPKKKGPVDALKPSQFVWVAQDVYEGPMKIVIVLDIQRIYVFQNDKLIGFSTISSGKKGKETPTGIFNILQKNVDHKSNLYSNAPMPFMQRLTWDGIAIHGGYLPGYPASHGCIRLPLAFAKALYGVTQMGQEVVVLQDTATPAKRPEPVPVVDPAAAPVFSPVEPTKAPPVTQPNGTEVFPPQPSN